MKDRAAGPTTSFTTRPARKGSKAARRCRSRSSCGPSRATTERASGPDLEIALLDGPAGVVRARAAELGFPNACDPAAPVSVEMTDRHDAAGLRQDTRVRDRCWPARSHDRRASHDAGTNRRAKDSHRKQRGATRNGREGLRDGRPAPVSYTHLTLPTNREV